MSRANSSIFDAWLEPTTMSDEDWICPAPESEAMASTESCISD